MKRELKQKIETREEVLNKVRMMIISSLKLDLQPEELDPDTTLFVTGLAFDSLDAVILVVDLEAEFGIVLSEEESMHALRTINSLVDIVILKRQEHEAK